MNIQTITFDKTARDFILSAFNKKVNRKGCIVEKSSGQPVLDQYGEEVLQHELGGIVKGSEIFIKSDFASLIDFVERRKWDY